MAGRLIRVAHVAGEPTASRVPQLELVARHPEIDLTVVYCAATIQRRSWSLDTGRAIVLDGPTIPSTRLLQHDYPVTPAVWPLLTRGRFDCIVVGGWSVFGAQAAVAWARTHRVPYVLFAESHLGEQRAGWVRAVKRAIVPRFVAPAAAHLVTGTLAREHALAYGARPDRIWVFPNTVDVDAYAAEAARLRPQRAAIRARLGLQPASVVVLAVNRLIPVKGVDVLLDAFARACEKSSVPLELLIVGDGPDRSGLEARGRHLPVTFAGFLEGRQLYDAYAAADVFALLSRRETWGIVVNEAMAFGLPLLLSSGVGAAADLLEPGGNGEQVGAGDTAATAQAIVTFAADPALRGRMGARSAEIVQSWGYGPSVEAYVAAVRAAVSGK